MKITALWFGGYSYAHPTDADAEHFDSIRQAQEVFDCRADQGYDPVTGLYTPCVEGDSMWIFFGQGPDMDLSYPDRIIERGPRGGVRVVRV